MRPASSQTRMPNTAAPKRRATQEAENWEAEIEDERQEDVQSGDEEEMRDN